MAVASGGAPRDGNTSPSTPTLSPRPPTPDQQNQPAWVLQLDALLFAAVVPFARPGRENEQEARAGRAGDRAALVGAEGEEASGLTLHRLAAGLDPHRA